MEVQQKVYDKLSEMGIQYEVTHHKAAFTIEEMDEMGVTKMGDVCKNLFLRDAQGRRHFLVVLDKDKKADLRDLQSKLGCSKLGFASEERLQKYLGLHKGEVTAMGVLNDTEHCVEVIFDEDITKRDRLGVHPNDNTATVWISYADLKKVVESNQNSIRVLKI